MTALRRSSMSFRRQGSSGLIWEDKIQAVEKKPTLKVTVSINKSDGEEHPNPDEGSRERKDADSHSPPDSSLRSKPDHSVHKCSFSTVFGRCLRPPAAMYIWKDELIDHQRADKSSSFQIQSVDLNGGEGMRPVDAAAGGGEEKILALAPIYSQTPCCQEAANRNRKHTGHRSMNTDFIVEFVFQLFIDLKNSSIVLGLQRLWIQNSW